MKQTLLVSFCMALGLVLAACGGGDEQATPTAVTQVVATNTPLAATDTPVAATGGMTGTDSITATEGITGPQGMTDTGVPSSTVGRTAMPTVTATDALTGTDATATDTPVMTGTQGMTGLPGVVRASQLLDYDVENANGDDLGSIQDALVALNQGCIDYMSLSFGGILGLGDRQYLIPWRAVQIDPANARLLLNIDPQVLNNAPVLDPNNPPDMMTENWDAPYIDFWRTVTINVPTNLESPAPMSGTTGLTDSVGMEGMMQPCNQITATGGLSAEASTGVTGTAAASETGINVEVPRVIRLSELLQYEVDTPEGEDLGVLEDIMVDWRQDRLAYAILSFGGILGLGEKWFVIPLDQLTLDPLNQRLVVAIEPERLQNAPGYDPNVLPDTADPNWDQEIRNYWRQIQ